MTFYRLGKVWNRGSGLTSNFDQEGWSFLALAGYFRAFLQTFFFASLKTLGGAKLPPTHPVPLYVAALVEPYKSKQILFQIIPKRRVLYSGNFCIQFILIIRFGMCENVWIFQVEVIYFFDTKSFKVCLRTFSPNKLD